MEYLNLDLAVEAGRQLAEGGLHAPAAAVQVGDRQGVGVLHVSDHRRPPLDRRLDVEASEGAELGEAVLPDRPPALESTARGAAMLAGVGVGLFRSGAEAAAVWKLERSFEPALSAPERQSARTRWLDAVRRARSPEKG